MTESPQATPLLTASGSTGDDRLTQGRWLRIPGPTVVHPLAVVAQTRDMIPHRGPEMSTFLMGLQEKARFVHRTEVPVLLWPASGSGGWEAAITNLLAPGERVVATVCGSFGDRFASVGAAFGLDVVRCEVPWGQGITPDHFGTVVRDAGPIKAVFITHNETSTGVTNPLRDLARIARAAGALVIVDAVSSAAAMPLEVDAWDLDWVLSGSQKAWMCPPGLMISAISERALAASRGSGYPTFYFDLQAMAKQARDGSTATTPALSLMYALDAALDAMIDEGIDAMWQRHERLGIETRSALHAMGIELLAQSGHESASITSFLPPAGMTSDELRKRVQDDSGIQLAVGQGHLADKVNRVGHMGWVDSPELEATFESIGRVVG